MPKLSDRLSKVVLHVSMFSGENELAIGTAFAYKIDKGMLIFTARHNLTGRHAVTKQPLSRTGAVPDGIVIRFWDKATLGAWLPFRFDLYDADRQPMWIEHPRYTDLVDVAALLVTLKDNITCYPINAESFDKIPLSPGLDVFILGFPMNISSGGRFPIWKRGSIATEPDFNIDNLPKVLVDSATREGLSGAPVIASRVGYWLPEGESDESKSLIGEGRRFLGVYTGRVGDDEFQAQLGIVWKASVLDEIATHVSKDLANSN